jgi:hypothetical protein
MGASAPSPSVSWPCPLEGHGDIQSSGVHVPSPSCRTPCAYNPRENLSIDGAESQKSSDELPEAEAASSALDDLSVHQRARVEAGRFFLVTPTLT